MAEEIKTFTQEEVDQIVSKRLARERAGMPSDEELTAFHAWQNGESRRENEELTATRAQLATSKADLEAANRELKKVKQESYLTGKGIAKDDIDYYGYKIEAMVTDGKTFEQAADEFLSAHPVKTVSVDFGGNLGGGTSKDTPNGAMNALLRRAVKG